MRFVRWFGLRCHQCADDTQVLLNLSSDTFGQCLEAVTEWRRTNKQKLNFNKMELLLVSPVLGSGDDILQLVVDGTVLLLKLQACTVEVLLDPALLLEPQVSSTASSAFYIASSIFSWAGT